MNTDMQASSNQSDALPLPPLDAPWTDEERRVCREEWERRVCAAIDDQTDDNLTPDKKDAEYEAGLTLIRQLRVSQTFGQQYRNEKYEAEDRLAEAHSKRLWAQGMDNEVEKLRQLAVDANEGTPWVADEYDYVTCPHGIVCEVRGIGRGKNEVLRNYIAAINPPAFLALIDHMTQAPPQMTEAHLVDVLRRGGLKVVKQKHAALSLGRTPEHTLSILLNHGRQEIMTPPVVYVVWWEGSNTVENLETPYIKRSFATFDLEAASKAYKAFGGNIMPSINDTVRVGQRVMSSTEGVTVSLIALPMWGTDRELPEDLTIPIR